MREPFTYFIFSDVHGEFDKLIKGLLEQSFDRQNPEHILVSLGDSFDRGNQNLRLYKFYEEMYDEGRLYHIKGNHDDFFLEFLLGNDNGVFNCRYNGMDRTIINFTDLDGIQHNQIVGLSHYAHIINDMHPKLLGFLENMPDILKIDDFILTHAGFKKEPHGEWYANNWARTDKFFEKFRKQETKYHYIVGHWHARRLRHAFRFKEEAETRNRIFMMNKMMGIDGMVNSEKVETVPIFRIVTDSAPEFIESKTPLSELEPNLEMPR